MSSILKKKGRKERKRERERERSNWETTKNKQNIGSNLKTNKFEKEKKWKTFF